MADNRFMAFCCFCFLLTTMQLLKPRCLARRTVGGQLDCLYGVIYFGDQPGRSTTTRRFNDNLGKSSASAFAWLAFAIISPGSDARVPPSYPCVTASLCRPVAAARSIASMNLNRWFITTSASSAIAGCAGAPLAAALGRGFAQLFPRGVAASRVGNPFRPAIAGARLASPVAGCDERARGTAAATRPTLQEAAAHLRCA